MMSLSVCASQSVGVLQGVTRSTQCALLEWARGEGSIQHLDPRTFRRLQTESFSDTLTVALAVAQRRQCLEQVGFDTHNT